MGLIDTATTKQGQQDEFDPASVGGTMRANVLKYWYAALRWWLLVVGIIAACLAAGIILTMLTPQLYTAQTQIEISRAKKNVTNVQGIEQNQNAYDNEFYDTQYVLLKAGSLAERVTRKLNLAANAGFFAAHGVDLTKSGTGAALDPKERKAREAMAAGLLLGGIKIVPLTNSSLVNITYTSRSPQWSAQIANAWPREFIGSTMERDYASNAEARQFLESMLNNLRGKLERSESDVLNFAANRGMVKLGGARDAQGRTEAPRTLVEIDLEALNAALLVAHTERIAAGSRVGSRGSVQGSTEGTGSLRGKRDDMAAQYAQLLVRFEPGYPAARALKAQIDALDGAIVRETQRAASDRQGSYQEALKRESDLSAQVQALKSRLEVQQRDSIQYNVYQREVDTNRQLYDALLQRYKEVGIAGAVGSSNVAIVDAAKVPGGPSSPNLNRNLTLALLGGVLLAALTVLGLEQINERVRNPSEVGPLLGVPLLGSIPRTEAAPLDGHGRLAPMLVEAYLSVRAVLALATSRGLPHSFVVTSAEPGEGKSTSAIALAAMIGRTGQKVLLIDGDMRMPSAHLLIGASNKVGFSNLLTGDNNYTAHIIATQMPGVSVLPAGPNPPSAAELLSSDRLQAVLEQLQMKFDYLVIDAPPVLALADAPLLVQAVEGCVFVIEAEKAGISSIRIALSRLRAVNSHVFGAVVTKFDPRHYGHGYDYDYNYGALSGQAAQA
jgi:succinoglycan biosynthesis transport protein ExoP